MNDERVFSLRAYPLSWPEGWKRTAGYARQRAKFGRSVTRPGYSYPSKENLTIAQATERVTTELSRMGINENDVVISTNLKLRLDGFPRSDQGNPADPGAAVYWRKRKSAMKCIAIDRYDRVEGNLAAIAATLEAMRSIERHGGAEILERTFQGFSALPAQSSSTWRESLGFAPQQRLTLEQVESAFRELAKLHHPDVSGGSDARFQEINAARAAARQELGAA